MRFVIGMKTPDVVSDMVDRLVEDFELENNLNSIDKDLREDFIMCFRQKLLSECDRWFMNGEFLRIEIDTKQETCTVLPASLPPRRIDKLQQAKVSK